MQTISHSLLNFLSLSYTAFPPFDALANENRIPLPELSSLPDSFLAQNTYLLPC